MRQPIILMVVLVLTSGIFTVLSPSKVEGAEPVWMYRTTTGPTPRVNHRMVYDSARGVTVLFGGGYYDWTWHVLGDTWKWDGSTWTLVDAGDLGGITAPSPREAPAMAYDSARGVTVLFGGGCYYPDGSWHYLGDTWEWNGTMWAQRFPPPPTPSPRHNHALAYDSARGVTVLFGGWDGSAHIGDTWEWDGSVWTLRATTGPSPRSAHALAYDSARGVTVLFGGSDSSGQDGETWEWDGTTWAQQFPPPPTPSPRSGHGLTYDSGRGVTVLFGGHNTIAVNGETWEWNGTTWAQRFPPPPTPSPRYGPSLTYDSARGVTVFFGGGYYGGENKGDTWEYGMDCNSNGVPDADDIAHDCCETGHGPGCSYEPIEACVCADDRYCCLVEWDQVCVDAVVSGECGPCDIDCNNNGHPDECDITEGTSTDCQADAIPDDCQLADNDCNTNGVPDDCEPNFDGDGLIDDCDSDIDNDGVPNESDVCDYTPLGFAPVLDPESCLYGTLRGDYDGDCDVDLFDYLMFQQDFTGPNP